MDKNSLRKDSIVEKTNVKKIEEIFFKEFEKYFKLTNGDFNKTIKMINESREVKKAWETCKIPIDDLKNVDITIDEYSKNTGFDKKTIIVEIAKKYGVSVVEATNWINISKGSLNVAINILSKISEYKRKTNDSKCECNLGTNKPKSISCDCENKKCDTLHEAMAPSQKYMNKLSYEITNECKKHAIFSDSTKSPFECVLEKDFKETSPDVENYLENKGLFCEKEKESITFEDLHKKTGIDYESFILMLSDRYNVSTYIVRELMICHKNDLNQLYKELNKISESSKIEGNNKSQISCDDKFDEIISDSNLLKQQNVVQQIKNKEYSYEQKDDTSPVYCKLRNGELIGPFYKNEKHQKDAFLEYETFMNEKEIKNLIFKYPNIEELIANVRKKYPQPCKAIKEGEVHQAQEIAKDSVLSEQPKMHKVIEDLDFDHSKKIIDKMACEKNNIPTNSELFEKIQVIERDINHLATIMGVKFGTPLEHVKDKNNEIKDALIKLINKL